MPWSPPSTGSTEVHGRALVVSNAEPRPIGEILAAIATAGGATPPSRHVPVAVGTLAGSVVEAVWAGRRLLGRPAAADPPMTRFLAEQLSTAHWFDQRETQRLLAWQPTVDLATGFARLAVRPTPDRMPPWAAAGPSWRRDSMHTGDWVALAIGLLHAAIAIVAAVYIAGNRKPSSAIAWIMAIVFIPYIGIVFFLLIGNWRLPQHRRDKQAHVSKIFLERTEGLHLASHPTEWPDWLPTIVALNRNLGALPMVGGNTAELLAGLPGLHPGHGRRDRRGRGLRLRRVLHPGRRRDDEADHRRHRSGL